MQFCSRQRLCVRASCSRHLKEACNLSFIISVYTNEGIVIASDSRTTYSTTHHRQDGIIEREIGVQITDTTFKTFLCQKRIGISTCGTSDINGVPITGFIEDFITKETNAESTVESVAQGLLQHFSKFNPNREGTPLSKECLFARKQAGCERRPAPGSVPGARRLFHRRRT